MFYDCADLNGIATICVENYIPNPTGTCKCHPWISLMSHYHDDRYHFLVTSSLFIVAWNAIMVSYPMFFNACVCGII